MKLPLVSAPTSFGATRYVLFTRDRNLRDYPSMQEHGANRIAVLEGFGLMGGTTHGILRFRNGACEMSMVLHFQFLEEGEPEALAALWDKNPKLGWLEALRTVRAAAK